MTGHSKPTNENNTGCIIMASGIGKRFGSNKLMADLAGKPMISYIIDATENLFAQRVVVTRHAEIQKLCLQRNLPVILHNLTYRNDTVRLGIETMGSDITGCMFCQGDQPLLSASTIRSFLTTAADNPEMILRASYENSVGTPVLFPRWTFPGLMNLPEGKGGNALIKKNPEQVLNVPVRDCYELLDVDRPQDLENIVKYLK